MFAHHAVYDLPCVSVCVCLCSVAAAKLFTNSRQWSESAYRRVSCPKPINSFFFISIGMKRSQRSECRKSIIDAILHTDMTRHEELVNTLKQMVRKNVFIVSFFERLSFLPPRKMVWLGTVSNWVLETSQQERFFSNWDRRQISGWQQKKQQDSMDANNDWPCFSRSSAQCEASVESAEKRREFQSSME